MLAFNFCAFSARSAVGIGDSSGAFLDGGGGWILGLLFLIWWGAGSGVCVIGLSGGIPCLKLHFISFHFIIFIQVKGSYIYVFQPDLFKRLK